MTALVRELGPVRVGNNTASPAGEHEFWNIDMGVASADESNPNGFRSVRLENETSVAMMPMERFWEPAEIDAVHYYSGSLLEEDGRASLPDLQRGLDALVSELGAGRAPRHYLKAWLGTNGATTPLHYDTQHNVYAQVHGSKEFWLLPPYAARHDVHLYPRVHPLSHFARGYEGGPSSLAEALTRSAACDLCYHCFNESVHWGGRCMLHVQVEEGEVLYLPPFWLHRARCASATCISTNVWVASQAMQRMEDIEYMPLPFEGHWAPPTRYAAVLAFLRALLRWIHAEERGKVDAIHRRDAERGYPPPPEVTMFPPESLTPTATVGKLLSTRWHQAEAELLRARAPDDTPSRAQTMAAAAECAPRSSSSSSNSGGGEVGGQEPDLAKIDRYARERAAALKDEPGYGHFEPERSWRGPKLLLVHDQLERIAHWATEGDAAATHALLRRLHRCCKELAAEVASPEDPVPERDEL